MACERDRLAGLVGLRARGVGVDEVARLAVVGEERQHGFGALRAPRDVVGLQGDVVAEVHDRVEVQIEVSARALAGLGHRACEAGEQRLVVRAREAVAVGAQRAGLGQRLQAGERGECWVGADIVDVADAAPADRLERQQRQHRGQRRDLAGARKARVGDRAGQIQRDQRRQQQHDAGMVAGDAHRLLGPAQPPDAWRMVARRCAALGRRSWPQPLVAFLDKQLPHPGAIERRPRPGERVGDLGDRVPGRAQAQHVLAGRQLGRRDARARATLDEELAGLGREVAAHRHDRRRGVPEALGDDCGRRALDEVRAQRLIAALRDIAGRGEERGTLTPPRRSITKTGALR